MQSVKTYFCSRAARTQKTAGDNLIVAGGTCWSGDPSDMRGRDAPRSRSRQRQQGVAFSRPLAIRTRDSVEVAAVNLRKELISND